ncbi:RidA family protein [Hymenobacter cellulosilyticus]|uniref:RidA family protein n=1 Tax=Hymenobacter cellulosilyticus TaxID=2932248 RepID=A0A8T9Q9I0_9BACT|nr:RidA family protein [Hymenobacter cellulosilyticus]UOQ71593.1 RidA family protein [Hymenobacter cellulosilyticus]
MKNLLLVILLGVASPAVAQSPEAKLTRLGLPLPPVAAAIGSYVDVVRVGNLLFLSGKGPRQPNGNYISGRLGADLTTAQGYEAARLTALLQLAVLKKELGDLSHVRRIVKVNGYVLSATGFAEQPQVLNGYSDLLIQVFGDRGKHARTAIGTNALPLGMALEVEMVVEAE